MYIYSQNSSIYMYVYLLRLKVAKYIYFSFLIQWSKSELVHEGGPKNQVLVGHISQTK